MLLRNSPGIKSEDWSRNWTVSSDSSFWVQEHIQALIRTDPSKIKEICAFPKDVDEHVWQYEQLRQIILQLNSLITYLLPHCTPATCPEMKSEGEYMYLCSSHSTSQSCSAIDYTIHTVEAAGSTLTRFPSRNKIAVKDVKQFSIICRRISRIFSHVYWKHKEVFFMFENESHLFSRFKYFAIVAYKLVPENVISSSIKLEVADASGSIRRGRKSSRIEVDEGKQEDLDSDSD